MAPIVPISEHDLPASDSESDLPHSDDEQPNFGIDEDLVESDNSINSGDEEIENDYQLLPQDPDVSLGGQTGENERMTANVTIQVLFENAFNEEEESSVRPPDEITLQLEAVNEAVRIEPEMDQDHIDKIKAAMANITLPSTSIPGWASTLSEDDWKNQLIEKINQRKTS